jgi:class 3 adenylate cyclase
LLAQKDELMETINNYKKELLSVKDDSTKLEIYFKLCNSYGDISLDSSIVYQEETEKFARQLNNKELLLKALILRGNTFRIKEDNKKALKYYLEAEKIMKALPLIKRDVYTLYYLAEIYRNEGKIDIAEKYFLNALQIADNQKNAESNNLRYVVLNGMIELYKEKEDFRNAERYLRKLEEVVKKMDNAEMIVLNKDEALDTIKDIRVTLKNLENSKYRTIFYSLIGIGITILVAVTFWLYQTKRRREKHNADLAHKNTELEVARRKSEELLLNILPKEVADELKEKGKANAKSYKRVTVLFTDFKGFTDIAAGLTPEKLIEELNDCFVKFDEIIKRYKMERIKTIGDAYMCVGGLPVENATNPIDSVLASLEIQRFMKERRDEKLAQGSDYWQCRLGINTGEVIAGVIGVTKFAYDVWGDTVNVASRMESNGEVGKVNIAENTYYLIKDFFTCVPRGKLSVKGKGEMEMFFVEGIRPELSFGEKGIEPNESFWKKVDETFFLNF